MAWVDPSTQVATHLVTADEYNEIVNDLKYLKGQAGAVSFEDDIDPSEDLTKNQGDPTHRWSQIYADKIYASNGLFAVQRYLREVIIDWHNLTRADWNIVPAASANIGNGDFDEGGTGQAVQWVLNNNIDGIYFGPRAEQNGAKDNSFNAIRSPYGRFEFNVSANHADLSVWIGFRETLGNAVPLSNAENFAGLYWNGAIWLFMNANGATQSVSGSQTVTANVRHVLEILIISGIRVIYALDGTILHTSTTTLPDGDLDWTIMSLSRNTVGALTFYTTAGRLLFQEELS